MRAMDFVWTRGQFTARNAPTAGIESKSAVENLLKFLVKSCFSGESKICDSCFQAYQICLACVRFVRSSADEQVSRISAKTRRFIADVSMALDGKFTNDLIREMYFKLLLIIVAVYSDEAAANNDGPTVDDMFTPIVAKKQKLTIKSSIAQ